MQLASPLALLSATLLLAACESDGVPVVVDPGVSADACHASDYKHLIGQTSPQITVSAGQAHRSYRTGDPVTLDLQATRLNFVYDRSGKLIDVTCG